MIGNSAIRPDEFVACDGGWQFRYNIIEQVETADHPVQWCYDYVWVGVVDRQVLIDALITDRYTYASQIGKLALTRTSAEWIAYNGFRQECIAKVDDALSRW